MVATEVGSVAVSVAMIATDERYGMILDTLVACSSFWFSRSSVMMFDSFGASHDVIVLLQVLLLTAVLLYVGLLAAVDLG